MRPIVLDPSFLLPAVLQPNSMRRRLLVVLAYGGLTWYTRFAWPEEAERIRQEGQAGAQIGGLDLAEVVDRASEVQAHAAQSLPTMTPDDLCLVSSEPLLDELART